MRELCVSTNGRATRVYRYSVQRINRPRNKYSLAKSRFPTLFFGLSLGSSLLIFSEISLTRKLPRSKGWFVHFWLKISHSPLLIWLTVFAISFSIFLRLFLRFPVISVHPSLCYDRFNFREFSRRKYSGNEFRTEFDTWQKVYFRRNKLRDVISLLRALLVH